jgi:hypothetical protein
VRFARTGKSRPGVGEACFPERRVASKPTRNGLRTCVQKSRGCGFGKELRATCLVLVSVGGGVIGSGRVRAQTTYAASLLFLFHIEDG